MHTVKCIQLNAYSYSEIKTQFNCNWVKWELVNWDTSFIRHSAAKGQTLSSWREGLAHETTFVLPAHSLSDDSDDESAVVRRERKKGKGGLFQKTNTQTASKNKRKPTCVRETAVVSSRKVGWISGTEGCVEGHHGTSLNVPWCSLRTEGVPAYISCLYPDFLHLFSRSVHNKKFMCYQQ